jgi:hypothetical protein
VAFPPENGSRMALASGGAARWAFFLALINAAGLYTQYAYPFVMFAQGVIFLVWLLTRIKTGNWRLVTGLYVAANLLTILLYLPWISTALHQLTTWPSTGQSIPAGEALGTIVGWSIFGMSHDQTPGMTTRNLAFVAWLALMLLIGGAGKWNIRRGQSTLWRVLLPILWIVVPIGLFLA